MSTPTNTQITDGFVKAFLHDTCSVTMANDFVARWNEFKSTHYTVTEERREGWEILEYRNKLSGTILGGNVLSPDSVRNDPMNVYEIYSVRRPLDNSLWTLNEDTPKGRIVKFEIPHPDGKMYVHYDLRGWDYLSQAKKAPVPEEPKPVLFTTLDNVSIREGDEYWTVCDKDGFAHLTWIPFKNKVRCLDTAPGEHNHTFSTEQAANEYILLNKPCLSVNDVLSLITQAGTPSKELLKTVAQQKIGGKD